MKQCDRPFSPPFAIGSSLAASESDPEDSFWSDFTFDFSFLTSEDQNNGDNSSRYADSTTLPKAAYAVETKGDLSRSVKDQKLELDINKGENSDSFLNLPNFLDSKPLFSPSSAVVSESHFDVKVTMGEGSLQHFPPNPSVKTVASGNSGYDRAEGRFPWVNKHISESNSSPLFSKMSKMQVKKCSNGSGINKQKVCSANGTVLPEKFSLPVDQDDSDVDSPCWRGTLPHNAETSLGFRRSTDDLNGLYGLNPLAPQFIPSNFSMNLGRNVREFEGNSSSSLKKSLSSTFPPPSGEFSLNDPSGIGQGSSHNSRIGIPIHSADESLGLVSQDSFCKTLSILDTSNEFQTSKKLDPLAPLFVPASAKLSAIAHEKHGAADHMIANEANAHPVYALSSSDDMLLNNVKAETYSPEANHSFKSPYSNSVHESGTLYSFNPRLGSQVQLSESTERDSSCNKSNGPKKLNPLAPQFSLTDTTPKVYGCEKIEAAIHLLPKLNSSRSTVSDVKASSNFDQRHGCSTSSPARKMDVKKLLTTIHGLSELLIHVDSSESSDSPNEQDLHLINCTVQNLNSYISSSVQEHTGSYIRPVHSSCDVKSLPSIRKQSAGDHQLPRVKNMSANADVKRKEKYAMVSGKMVQDPDFSYSVTKENGFGKVIGNHQTEEQMNPQMFFYRSLWLKAKADRSLMEYETYLSKTRA